MNAGVRSRGSPMPKSISSMPRADASALQSSSRVNGYCARSARTGESCTLRRYRRGSAAARERPLELADLDPLVDRVGVAGRAGAEVDGIEPARREVGDVRPGLLRLDRELADRAEPLDERRAAARRARAASWR